jgi:hypothetical protein
LEKQACGRFSDISFVAASKKRGFCRLRNLGQRKSDRLLVSYFVFHNAADFGCDCGVHQYC